MECCKTETDKTNKEDIILEAIHKHVETPAKEVRSSTLPLRNKSRTKVPQAGNNMERTAALCKCAVTGKCTENKLCRHLESPNQR